MREDALELAQLRLRFRRPITAFHLIDVDAVTRAPDKIRLRYDALSRIHFLVDEHLIVAVLDAGAELFDVAIVFGQPSDTEHLRTFPTVLMRTVHRSMRCVRTLCDLYTYPFFRTTSI